LVRCRGRVNIVSPCTTKNGLLCNAISSVDYIDTCTAIGGESGSTVDGDCVISITTIDGIALTGIVTCSDSDGVIISTT
jgi:hypothetical protein